VDWKPEKAVQAKVMDFQKRSKTKKAWLLRRANGGTLYTGLQIATSSRLLINNGLSPPRGISCYLVPGFRPSTTRFVHNSIISKEFFRVFVLRCRSTSRLTCFVLSRLIEFTCNIRCIQSYKLHSYIYTFLHPYSITFILTLILPRIRTFMHTQHIHNINSYVVASVTQSLVWSYPFSSFLNRFKWSVLNNGQLEFTSYRVSSGSPK